MVTDREDTTGRKPDRTKLDTTCGKNTNDPRLLLLHSSRGKPDVNDDAYLRGLLQAATIPALLSPTIITQALCFAAAMADEGLTTVAQTLENQARK